MENKPIYIVHQLCSGTVRGAIGYVPVFGDLDKAITASEENKYAVKKMEMVNIDNAIAMKRNKILNNIQNSRL